MTRVEVTCDSCTITFAKPKLKSGDATMCPRCRSLVVVPAEPVPRAPSPPPEPEPMSEPVEAPFAGEDVAREQQAEPIAAEAERAHVALLRSCPWCQRRYDVELSKCPRCGHSAARAQMRRNEAEEAGPSLRPTQAPPRESWRWVVGAIAGLLLLGRASRSGGSVVLGLLVLGGLVWLAARAYQSSGAEARSHRHDRDQDRGDRP